MRKEKINKEDCNYWEMERDNECYMFNPCYCDMHEHCAQFKVR
jgi:hypothetical protein